MERFQIILTFRLWGRIIRRLNGCRYLGLFADEIDAAQAYDRASVAAKGLKAVTNFDISEYLDLLSKEDLHLLHARNPLPPDILERCQAPLLSLWKLAQYQHAQRSPLLSWTFPCICFPHMPMTAYILSPFLLFLMLDSLPPYLQWLCRSISREL